MVPDHDDDDEVAKSSKKSIESKKKINFASQAAGAFIANSHPESGRGYSNLLNNDRDKYANAPCAERKWVVIALSEDVIISSVVIANYEKHSSKLEVNDTHCNLFLICFLTNGLRFFLLLLRIFNSSPRQNIQLTNGWI